MDEKYKWLAFCFIGGAIMIYGLTQGFSILSRLYGLYSTYGEVYLFESVGYRYGTIISTGLLLLFYVVVSGGISVIIGSFLILFRIHRIGRLIISLGTGFGVVGLIFYITFAPAFIPGIQVDDTIESFSIFVLLTLLQPYFIGVILSIIGRKKLKSLDKKNKKEKKKNSGVTQQTQSFLNPEDESVSCITCNAVNPRDVDYCKQCGSSL